MCSLRDLRYILLNSIRLLSIDSNQTSMLSLVVPILEIMLVSIFHTNEELYKMKGKCLNMHKKAILILLSLSLLFLVGCDSNDDEKIREEISLDFLERYYSVSEEDVATWDEYYQLDTDESKVAYTSILSEQYSDILIEDELRDLIMSRYLGYMIYRAHDNQTTYSVDNIKLTILVDGPKSFVYDFTLLLMDENNHSNDEAIKGQIRLEKDGKSYKVTNTELNVPKDK